MWAKGQRAGRLGSVRVWITKLSDIAFQAAPRDCVKNQSTDDSHTVEGQNYYKEKMRCYKLHASNGRLVLGGQNGRDGMEWLIRAILHSLSAGGSGHLIGYCNLHCFWPSLNDCPLTSTFRLRSLVAFFLLPGNYCFNKIETSDCFSPLEIFQWFQLKFQVSEVCF